MNRIINIAIVICLFAACKNTIIEVVEKTHTDGTPKTVRYYKVEKEQQKLVKEIAYYENHNKQYEGEYREDKRNGKWTYWYMNGNIWSEGWFADGENDSTRNVYHENGKIYYSGKYDIGKRVGVWKFWDENGKLLKEINYDK